MGVSLDHTSGRVAEDVVDLTEDPAAQHLGGGGMAEVEAQGRSLDFLRTACQKRRIVAVLDAGARVREERAAGCVVLAYCQQELEARRPGVTSRPGRSSPAAPICGRARRFLAPRSRRLSLSEIPRSPCVLNRCSDSHIRKAPSKRSSSASSSQRRSSSS